MVDPAVGTWVKWSNHVGNRRGMVEVCLEQRVKWGKHGYAVVEWFEKRVKYWYVVEVRREKKVMEEGNQIYVCGIVIS